MSSVVLLFKEGRSQFICLLLLLIAIDFCKSQERVCTTPQGFHGNCVSGGQCKWVKNALLRYGTNLPADQSKFLRDSRCQGTNHVCCKMSEIERPPAPPFPVYEINPTGMEILQNQDCGTSDLYKVSHGYEADPGAFPWMALLKYDIISKDTNPYQCGGSLITNRYVLTAAHCRQQQAIIGVVLGEHNISTEIDCKRKGRGQRCSGPAVEYGVERLIPHPQYLQSYLLNDIMLIKLDRNVEFKNYIQPICLSIPSAGLTYPAEFFIAGWGRTERATSSNTLQYAKVQARSWQQCVVDLKDQRINADRHICAAGAQQSDTCKGDSGGPLFFISEYQRSVRFVQYGVVSAGVLACGYQNYPSIFTNVSNQLAWITNNIIY